MNDTVDHDRVQHTSAPDESLHELEKCLVERDEWKDKYFHISADFENYKRRLEKEQRLWSENSHKRILYDLLFIIDDFDRAIAALDYPNQENSDALRGISLIRESFFKLLQK